MEQWNEAGGERVVPHPNEASGDGYAKILELEASVQELQQQNCSMQKQISELVAKTDGRIQQQVQDSAIVFPSPSSQTDESITTRYKLVIRSVVSEIVHIGRPIGTNEGNGITVAVEDLDGKQVAAGHHLASLKVELVVVKAEFYENVWDWTKDEFEANVIKTDIAKEKIKSAIFQLKDGKCVNESTRIHKSSNKQYVRLGVKVHGHSTERILEGVSNRFKVEHGRRAQKTEQESLTRPGITQNSPKKDAGGKKRATDTQLPMANALAPDQYYAASPSRKQGKGNEPRSRKQVTSQDPFEECGTTSNGDTECGTTSNGDTEMDATMGLSDVTDEEILHATVGDQPSITNNPPDSQQFLTSMQPSQAVFQAAAHSKAYSMGTGGIQDGNSDREMNLRFLVAGEPLTGTPGGNHSPATVEENQMSRDDPQKLACKIMEQKKFVCEIVRSADGQSVPSRNGYKALLEHISNLDKCLPYIYAQLHPQEQARNINDLRCCHGVVEEIILQLALVMRETLRDELINFFSALKSLKRALGEMVEGELDKLVTGPETAQPDLGGNRENGTSDQNQRSYSDAIACTESTNHQNPPHATQVIPSADAHHSSPQGQTTDGPLNCGQEPVALDLPVFVPRPLCTKESLSVDSLQLKMGPLSIDDECATKRAWITPPEEFDFVELKPTVKQKSHAQCGYKKEGVAQSFDQDFNATCEKGVRNTLCYAKQAGTPAPARASVTLCTARQPGATAPVRGVRNTLCHAKQASVTLCTVQASVTTVRSSVTTVRSSGTLCHAKKAPPSGTKQAGAHAPVRASGTLCHAKKAPPSGTKQAGARAPVRASGTLCPAPRQSLPAATPAAVRQQSYACPSRHF